MADPLAPPPPRAPVPASPEVLSLFAPASSSLTPIRIFVSLSVLLVFLLVAFFSPSKGRSTARKGGKIAVKAGGAGGKTSKTVLLVGPLAAGKTALFSKLVYGHVQPSHTSMKENEAVITRRWDGASTAEAGDDKHELLDEKASPSHLETPLHLVDIPGHPRLRTRSLAQYLPAADGIVFTIDGAAGLTGKNVRDAAEHLHVLLSLLALHSGRQPNLPPLLILLTKSDLSSSSSSSSSTTAAGKTRTSSSPTLSLERAKQSLLRELERRRLASTGASASAASTSAPGGNVPLSAGAKLEGLDAIPSSSAGNSQGGVLGSLLSLFGLGGSSSTSTTTAGIATLLPDTNNAAGGLPSDENEILSLASEDVFAFEGSADWDKLASAVGGLEVQWRVASAREGQGESESGGGEGVKGLYEWVEQL